MGDHTEPGSWIADENITWLSVETRDAVRRRRAELYDVMRDLESAIARPSGLTDWRIEIERALTELKTALDDHVNQVESESGLFAQVLRHAPHLQAEVSALDKEHRALEEGCNTALTLTADLSDSALRRRVNELLADLVIHRQLGAELLYDAYNVDIAAAD